jgi:hypothetical protein
MNARTTAGALALLCLASTGPAEQPLLMERMVIDAPRLDLSPDKNVDTLNAKERRITYYLGNRVATGSILAAFSIDQLSATYLPTYDSMDAFTDGVIHPGWVVRETRVLSDFYVAVMRTPSGHLAGVYYAKSPAGRAIQRAGSIQLFVADERRRQIVPDSGAYSLDQRIVYAVASSSVGANGLIPLPVDDRDAGERQSGSGIPVIKGSLYFHEGELFFMKRKPDHFLFVFKAGPSPSDWAEIPFANWFDPSTDDAPDGFTRVSTK